MVRQLHLMHHHNYGEHTMNNVSQDFDRLNDVSQQYAPPQHHGPSPAAIAAVGTLAWLGVREYNYQQAVANGTIPPGYKRSVWGWYAVLAAVLHFGIFLFWYSNANHGDDYFWAMALGIGTAIWGPTWIAVFFHQRRIRRFNGYLFCARAAMDEARRYEQD